MVTTFLLLTLSFILLMASPFIISWSLVLFSIILEKSAKVFLKVVDK